MINKKIKHRKDMKKIKKEVMKNMIEGPPLQSLLFSEMTPSKTKP